MPVTELTKPLRRRIGDLVVELTTDGLRVRGKHKQTWVEFRWVRVLSLSGEAEAEQLPALTAMELAEGKRVHARLTTPCKTKMHRVKK